MPSYYVKTNVGTFLVHDAGTYKPGDMPPEGYTEWHEWAEVQRKAGIKQSPCGLCGLWRTPQEMSATVREWSALNRYGERVPRRSRVCLKCEAKFSVNEENNLCE